MAVLVLTKVWLNLLATGEAVSAQSGPDRAHSHSVSGEVISYAGGAQRAFSQAGESTRIPFRLIDVPTATLATLRAWAGLAVQFRDQRGQCWTGVYFDHDVVDKLNENTLHDVSMTLQTITYPDGV